MSKGKVLLVDDEKIILKAYARELESAGYEVFKAMRAQDAVEIVQKESPDIVYTDLVMPEINGVEICRSIKEIAPDVEVVLISGYPEETIKYQIDFITAGGREEWLRKPLESDELVNTTDKILGEKRI